MGPGSWQDRRDDLITTWNTARAAWGLIPDVAAFLRFLRGFLRVRLLGREQLRFVEIFTTLSCNARCAFCSTAGFTDRDRRIPLAAALDVIDQCADLDVPVVCLIGGEPLLYPDLTALVRRIRSHGMLSMVATNASLLSEEKVAELADAGLTNVTASLLAAEPALHDERMGLPGSWARLFQARERCRRRGVSFSLATVVAHADFLDGTFERLVALAHRERMALSVNPLIPSGPGAPPGEALLQLDDVRRLDAVARRSRYVSTHLTNNFFGFGCPAGNGYLGVSVTGEILPCFFMPISLGNVASVTLRQAWLRALHSPLFARRHRMCYAGVSREFQARYLAPVFAGGRVPIPVEEHPLYDARIVLPDLQLGEVAAAVACPAGALRTSGPSRPSCSADAGAR